MKNKEMKGSVKEMNRTVRNQFEYLLKMKEQIEKMRDFDKEAKNQLK
jgi:hypothetical protein